MRMRKLSEIDIQGCKSQGTLIWCRFQQIYTSSIATIVLVLEIINNGSALPRLFGTQMADIGHQKC